MSFPDEIIAIVADEIAGWNVTHKVSLRGYPTTCEFVFQLKPRGNPTTPAEVRAAMFDSAQTVILAFEAMGFGWEQHPEIRIGGEVFHKQDGTDGLVADGRLELSVYYRPEQFEEPPDEPVGALIDKTIEFPEEATPWTTGRPQGEGPLWAPMLLCDEHKHIVQQASLPFWRVWFATPPIPCSNCGTPVRLDRFEAIA